MDLCPGVEYIYRQSSRDCNPKELNSAVEVLLLVSEEEGAKSVSEDVTATVVEEGEGPWNRIGKSALLHLLAHLVSIVREDFNLYRYYIYIYIYI